jgi:hypothetical protein
MNEASSTGMVAHNGEHGEPDELHTAAFVLAEWDAELCNFGL